MSVSNRWVRDLRLERGWSQEQLAAISGLSERTIQRIEKTGECSLDSRLALASAFEVPPSGLDAQAELSQAFAENEIDGASTGGYIVGLSVFAVLAFLLTNTNGVWEIACLLIVEGIMLVLSATSHGWRYAIRFIAVMHSPLKKPIKPDNLNKAIVQANQLKQYAYATGLITAAVYLLVVFSHAPHKLDEVSVVLTEAVVPLLYAVLLTEMWIRPFKHRMETLLLDSRFDDGPSASAV